MPNIKSCFYYLFWLFLFYTILKLKYQIELIKVLFFVSINKTINLLSSDYGRSKMTMKDKAKTIIDQLSEEIRHKAGMKIKKKPVQYPDFRDGGGVQGRRGRCDRALSTRRFCTPFPQPCAAVLPYKTSRHGYDPRCVFL